MIEGESSYIYQSQFTADVIWPIAEAISMQMQAVVSMKTVLVQDPACDQLSWYWALRVH
jgi:hypothetical protein